MRRRVHVCGGGEHICEYLFRDGGTPVHVCSRYPNGLVDSQFRTLLSRNPAAARWNWAVMRRNPSVLVRGKVSHADHATIRLAGWHQVVMNTENESRALRHVAFLD